MRKRFFPGLGREASVLALGTMAFGTSISEEDSFAMLDRFFELGGNFLDTARVYGFFDKDIGGVSEGVIGRWMKERGNREGVILGTKGAHPPLRDMRSGRLDRASIRGDMDASLQALGTEYVDMYWLHRDDESRPVEEIVSTLNELLREGKARALGASNWSLSRLREANEFAASAGLAGFIATQPQWSLARQETLEDPTLVVLDGDMYRWHLSSGLPVVPFTSQAKGFFYKLAEGGEAALSPKAKDRFLSPRNLRSYEKLREIYARTGASVGALSIAYLTSQPFPVYPIVGFSSLTQAESMKEAGELLLSPADLSDLNRLSEIAQ